VEFDAAPFGMIGLETTLGVIMTKLYHTRILSISEIVSLLSVNPRKILGLPIPKIEPGASAEVTLIDPDLEWTVNPEEFLSKSRNSGFRNWKLKGSPVGIIHGQKMFLSARLRYPDYR
jgi:dihydroorotase